MAAVMVERPRDDVSRVQDPDCRGHHLLIKWAPYRRDAKRMIDAPKDGKMPWKDRESVAFDAEPEWVVPVDRAIASMVKLNFFYEKVIDRYYLDGQSIWQTAGNLDRTPGFILAYINAICSRVEERVAYDPRRL
jgi:hypothetical protein